MKTLDNTVSEKLKIKFTGNNIEPNIVSANEFAKVVTAYENALLAVLKKNKSGSKLNNQFISIVNIKHESLTIEASPHTEDIKAAANEINTAIKTSRINRLPIEAVENLIVFQQFVNKFQCKAILNGIEGIETAEITIDSNIRITESFFFKGETTVYGKIMRIGGTEPKVRIKTDSGKSLSVVINVKDAKLLSKHLYSKVGIKGTAKWKKENNELMEIKAKSFVLLKDVPLTEKLKGLSNLLGKYWTNVDNPDEYVTSLRD